MEINRTVNIMVYIHDSLRVRASSEPLWVWKRMEAWTPIIRILGFRVWPLIDQRVILGHFSLNFSSLPECKSQGARIIWFRAWSRILTPPSSFSCQIANGVCARAWLFYCCSLRKDPKQRATTTELLVHPFITMYDNVPDEILADLVKKWRNKHDEHPCDKNQWLRAYLKKACSAWLFFTVQPEFVGS
jgi:serine/threonine protein kinase